MKFAYLIEPPFNHRLEDGTVTGCEVEIDLDHDDFWLNQPKVINLIVSKVLEQLFGLDRTHVALVANRQPE